jgi:hypothetical protein
MRVLLLLLAALGPGCLASSVVDSRDRAVKDESAAIAWQPARAEELGGLWRARSIEGPAAAALLDICYWFDSDGHFSGAALFPGPPPAYQVLSGAWSTTADGRVLLGEDAEPARIERARVAGQELLRLTGAEGRLVLERAEVE